VILVMGSFEALMEEPVESLALNMK
jgi:hypothetical protein